LCLHHQSPVFDSLSFSDGFCCWSSRSCSETSVKFPNLLKQKELCHHFWVDPITFRFVGSWEEIPHFDQWINFWNPIWETSLRADMIPKLLSTLESFASFRCFMRKLKLEQPFRDILDFQMNWNSSHWFVLGETSAGFSHFLLKSLWCKFELRSTMSVGSDLSKVVSLFSHKDRSWKSMLFHRIWHSHSIELLTCADVFIPVPHHTICTSSDCRSHSPFPWQQFRGLSYRGENVSHQRQNVPATLSNRAKSKWTKVARKNLRVYLDGHCECPRMPEFGHNRRSCWRGGSFFFRRFFSLNFTSLQRPVRKGGTFTIAVGGREVEFEKKIVGNPARGMRFGYFTNGGLLGEAIPLIAKTMKKSGYRVWWHRRLLSFASLLSFHCVILLFLQTLESSHRVGFCFTKPPQAVGKPWLRAQSPLKPAPLFFCP
jgi:hypothetical protein